MARNNELIRVAKKAADAWRNTDAYHQAAQIIDMLVEELESDTLTQPNEGARDKNVPTNEPLTLDDLRKIDTVTPLWVHDSSWGRHKPRLMLVRYVASHYWSCVDFDGFEIVKADDYGSRYLIYRRPPEEEV